MIGTRALRAAAWTGDSLLVLVGRFRRLEPGAVEAGATLGTRRVALEGRCLPLGRRSKIVVLGFPEDEPSADTTPSLELRSSGRPSSIKSRALDRALVDPDELVRKELAGLDRATREDLHALILSLSIPRLDGSRGFSLGRDLHAVRDALRTPLPRRPHDRDEAQAVCVDRFFAVDDGLS